MARTYANVVPRIFNKNKAFPPGEYGKAHHTYQTRVINKVLDFENENIENSYGRVFDLNCLQSRYVTRRYFSQFVADRSVNYIVLFP